METPHGGSPSGLQEALWAWNQGCLTTGLACFIFFEVSHLSCAEETSFTLGQCSFSNGAMQKSRDFPSLLRPPLFLLSKGECRGISTVWQYDSNSAIQLSHLQKLENWSWWIIPKEKEMATHSSILAWKIPQRNLASYSPWGTKSRTQLSI